MCLLDVSETVLLDVTKCVFGKNRPKRPEILCSIKIIIFCRSLFVHRALHFVMHDQNRLVPNMFFGEKRLAVSVVNTLEAGADPEGGDWGDRPP